MAKELKQTVAQNNIDEFVPKRIIVQYKDSDTGENDQKIINYDDMSVESKAIYDTFIQMCEVYMNNNL
jgi:hypothetical protein